jgi:thiol-disulfide isomerase/thioredoxin
MSPKPAQEFGSVAEDFALPVITYGSGRLSQIMEGKRGAVVVFWSGVCSHCVRYDAYLNSFSKLHPELALVAIASRYGETIPQIRSTVAERRLTFPLLHDQGGVVAQQWITQQTPRAFLLDANRGLLYRGAIDNFKYPNEPEYAGYLENAIEDFLAARPVRRSETAGFGCAIQSVYYILPRHL